VLWHCWLGHLTRKNPSSIWPIMCLVGRQTLLNQSINQSITSLTSAVDIAVCSSSVRRSLAARIKLHTPTDRLTDRHTELLSVRLPSNLRQTTRKCVYLAKLSLVTSDHATKMAVTPFDPSQQKTSRLYLYLLQSTEPSFADRSFTLRE